MPSISLKGHKMPESPIRKLVPFAENAKKNGVKVAPEIKIVEAKITILPVTVYAREIIISDALEACEV